MLLLVRLRVSTYTVIIKYKCDGCMTEAGKFIEINQTKLFAGLVFYNNLLKKFLIYDIIV